MTDPRYFLTMNSVLKIKGLHQQVEKIRIFEIVQLRLNIIIKKGGLREYSLKMKRGIGLRRKILDGDRYYNLTSICCVYKEQVLNTTHTEELSVNKIQ